MGPRERAPELTERGPPGIWTLRLHLSETIREHHGDEKTRSSVTHGQFPRRLLVRRRLLLLLPLYSLK